MFLINLTKPFNQICYIASNGRITVNDSNKLCKEAVITILKLGPLSQYFQGGTEKNDKIPYTGQPQLGCRIALGFSHV